MKLNISHPEKQSLTVVSRAIDNGETIYRSPHVGNVNNEELSLALGIGAMGGKIQLELVDTIRGNDSYSQPKVAVVGLQKITLASNKHAGRIVGSCEAKTEGVEQLKSIGIAVSNEAETLKDIHVESLRLALPGSTTVTPSTEFFEQIGPDVYEMVLRASEEVVSRPLRQVTDTGRIEEVVGPINFGSIYGPKNNRGLLPPLEAMMAIEIIKKVTENEGNDSQIIHIGGASMTQYTKESGIMQPVEDIANNVLSTLGISSGVLVEYVVPCRENILCSPNFSSTISTDVNSQYDILVSRQADKE